MKSLETKITRVIAGKIEPGEDLVDSIINLVKEYNIYHINHNSLFSPTLAPLGTGGKNVYLVCSIICARDIRLYRLHLQHGRHFSSGQLGHVHAYFSWIADTHHNQGQSEKEGKLRKADI